MNEKEIKDLRQAIEFVLMNFPKGRDSDQWLTIKIWALFFTDRIHEDKPDPSIENAVVRKYVYLEDVMYLPREDNVKRLRAKIQNEEGKWLPTTWKVAKQRRILESVWRNYVNQN